MGLFDLIKSRTIPPHPPVEHGETTKLAVLAKELEIDKKLITTLRTAGRETEADKVAADYQAKMAEYCQLTFQAWEALPLSDPTPHQMAQISHEIAYLTLPGQAHGDFEAFLSHWRKPAPPFYFPLCEQGCAKRHIRPTPDFATAFKKYEAEVSPDRDCFIIEFPPPPTYISLPAGELIELMAKAPEDAPVLAPYFAAIVSDRPAHRRHYYVLNQAIETGTTLRTVNADGVNNRLGDGPEATAQAFLNWIISQHEK
ncbi:hypothetical protein BH09VER1_BH09VER1_25210 [soil metagenome]